jgi:Leucine-rich repeat (LRR) protein
MLGSFFKKLSIFVSNTYIYLTTRHFPIQLPKFPIMKHLIPILLFTITTSVYVQAQILDEKALSEAPIFESMEEALKSPEKVHRLKLSGLKLKVLPKEINKFKNLQELDLRHNEIAELSEVLAELSNLQVLWLSQNKGLNLKTAFPIIAELKNLEELWLRESAFQSIPDEIEALAANKKLRLLHLGSNELMKVPEAIGKLKSLERLDIEMNPAFMLLPESIGNLKNLKELDLEDNNLANLPESISKMKKLENLDVQGNNLTSVPENIHKMKSLKILNLSGNPINVLPTNITKMASLDYLDLSTKVSFSFNPETFEEEVNKVSLDLDWEKTFDLLAEIKSLKELHIDNANLKKLPDNIKKLQQLERLELEGNRMNDEYQEQLQKMLPNTRFEF